MECSRWNYCWGFNISKVHGSDPAALFHKNDYWNKKGLQNFPFMPHPYLMKGVRAWGSALCCHFIEHDPATANSSAQFVTCDYSGRPWAALSCWAQPCQILTSPVLLGSNLDRPWAALSIWVPILSSSIFWFQPYLRDEQSFHPLDGYWRGIIRDHQKPQGFRLKK